MKYIQKKLPTAREVLRAFADHQRLLSLIMGMTKEIERLTEDNNQLRAAVGIYREIDRRGSMAVAKRA